MSSVVVRFAPSPTGPLHIGGVRTALYNWFFARKHKGRFILRIEDTDQNRYVPGAEEHILESLRWLGILWDEGPVRQSERVSFYQQWAEELVRRGYAYYAFDTEEELERMRADLRRRGIPNPQYNYITRQYMRNSLTLPEEEVHRLIHQEKVPYVIRLKVNPDREIRFYDEVRGWIRFQGKELDDKVLLKSDGFPTYHLANVVDDHMMEVSHVIRGEEWIPSTPIHILLYEALEWKPPVFAHLPLILRPDGKGKLSKRDAELLGFPVFVVPWKDPRTGEVARSLQEQGFIPEGIVNILALMGWHPPDAEREIFTMEEMVSTFRLEDISSSGARLNVEKALWINQQHLRRLAETDEGRGRLRMYLQQFSPCGEEISRSSRRIEDILPLLVERSATLRELCEAGRGWWSAPTEEMWKEAMRDDGKRLTPEEGKQFLQAVEEVILFWTAETRAREQWNPEVIREQIREIARNRELKPGKLMFIIRVGVSGKKAGPSLPEMLAWLGKEEVVQRLKQFVEWWKHAWVHLHKSVTS